MEAMFPLMDARVGLALAIGVVVMSGAGLLLSVNPRGSRFTGHPTGRDGPSSAGHRDEDGLDWLARVSHELRTPLTSIHGALHLMADQSVRSSSADSEELLRIATENSQRMLMLLNELLDYRKNLSVGQSVRTRMTDAAAIADEAIRSLDPISRARSVEIVQRVDSAALLVDHERIVQVLVNVVHNALKASPSSSTVTVAGRVGTSGYRFVVDDEGTGVPHDLWTRIFDPFEGARVGLVSDFGTGLGLAICAQIMNAHQGSITVESAPRTGARFIVTLPNSSLVDLVGKAG